MLTHTFGEPLTLRIPLRLHGEPVIPDANSVTFSLRGQDGTLLIANEPVTMAAGSTEAHVTIPAEHNAAGTGRIGHRTLIVRFAKSGLQQVAQHTYRLAPWLNTTVSADSVRQFIGLDRGELPDDAIDLTIAYMNVETLVGQDALEAALAAGTFVTHLANQMILGKAVLNLGPSLPLRISQSESNGVFSVTRPKIDLDRLMAHAQALVDAGLAELVPDVSGDATLFIVAAISPDPITGG